MNLKVIVAFVIKAYSDKGGFEDDDDDDDDETVSVGVYGTGGNNHDSRGVFF